ncbi:MAG: hypothetical protein ACI910_003288, partial [Oleispira sp.]
MNLTSVLMLNETLWSHSAITKGTVLSILFRAFKLLFIQLVFL